MLQFGIKGRIIAGKYKGWFILIKPSPAYDFGGHHFDPYNVILGKDIELEGGFKDQVYNSYLPTFGSMVSQLKKDEIIENDTVNIEWIE